MRFAEHIPVKHMDDFVEDFAVFHIVVDMATVRKYSRRMTATLIASKQNLVPRRYRGGDKIFKMAV
jgi:hypothetical protein